MNRVISPCESTWNAKLWAISHENGHKTRKQKVFVHALKHVSGLKVILNRPRTTKLLSITHENGHKTQNRQVFGDALKHVSGLTIVVNRPRTPKLWAISHENSHQMKKQRVFVYNCQTCKSPWNPKNVRNSS